MRSTDIDEDFFGPGEEPTPQAKLEMELKELHSVIELACGDLEKVLKYPVVKHQTLASVLERLKSARK